MNDCKSCASKDAEIAQLKQVAKTMEGRGDFYEAQFNEARAQLSTQSQSVWECAIAYVEGWSGDYARRIAEGLRKLSVDLAEQERSRASPALGREELADRTKDGEVTDGCALCAAGFVPSRGNEAWWHWVPAKPPQAFGDYVKCTAPPLPASLANGPSTIEPTPSNTGE